MSTFSISKYMVKENIVLLNRLFLSGDIVYIQDYDPVAGRPQLVFSDNKELLGKIESKTYWEIEKKLDELK